MKCSMPCWGLAAALLCGALPGCETRHHIIVEQPKPLEVNINLSGRLDLVIHDARQVVEQITGEKPQQTVRPEDIGLPAAAASSAPGPGAAAGFPQDALAGPVVCLADFGRAPAPAPVATEAELKKSLAQRHAHLRAILDAQVAGESHTGLVVVRGKVSAAQQATIDAENADRSALYALEAKRRNIGEAEVALGYYLPRLGHARKGDWYDKFNKAKNVWEWHQWGLD